MKTNTPKTWLGFVAVAGAAALFFTVTSWMAAAPTGEKLRPNVSEQIDAADDSFAATDELQSGDERPGVLCTSQNRRKCTICYHNQTRTLPCQKAREFLERHPTATKGRCPHTGPQ